MKERNRDSLRRALQQLPSYDPTPACWEQIEGELSAADISAPAIPLRQRLPEYSPPATVWNQINEQLNTARRAPVQLPRWPRLPVGMWRAAAAIALLLGSFAVVQALNQGPKVSYSYRKETNFDPASSVPDWRQEEPQFQQIATELADTDHPAVNRLRAELEELTSARGDIETMLEDYGADPQLVRQLGEIERERSEVYRQLIVYR